MFKVQSLIDQEYLCITLVGGLDGGTALYNRTDVELHTRHIGCSSQSAAITQLAKYLIAVLLSIAVLGIEADRCGGDIQLLTVGCNSHLRHRGNKCRKVAVSLGEADAVEVEEALRALRLLGSATATELEALLLGLLDLWTFGH